MEKNKEMAAQAATGMDHAIYQDLEPEARKAKLAELCDKVMRMTYERPYTEEELDEKRTKLSEICIRISDLERELAVVKRQYKDLIAPREADREVIVDDLRRGGIDVTEDCYVFVDYNLRKAGLYNRDGILIREEDITADMEQATIFQQLREEPEYQDQNEGPALLEAPDNKDEGNEESD